VNDPETQALIKELREFNRRLRVLQVLQFIDALYPLYLEWKRPGPSLPEWTACRGYRLAVTRSPQNFLLEKGFPWELRVSFGSFTSSAYADQDQITVAQWLPGDSDTAFPQARFSLFDQIQLGHERADLYLTPPRSLVPICPIMAEYSGAFPKSIYISIHYQVPQPPSTGRSLSPPQEGLKLLPLPVKGR
jgi:hypothetical protein